MSREIPRRSALAAAIGAGVALTCVAAAPSAGASPVGRQHSGLVRTDKGLVRGTVSGDHTSFQGIPYAAPPVGKLRWTPPHPATAWTGVRNATRPGSTCAQTAGFLGDKASVSEDCLYLNVTAPRNAGARKLPVMVWIHGGGFYSGSGAIYGAERMAVKGNVVVVSLNYRLGVFGFLAHPSLDGGPGKQQSGDFGLEDQQAALHWVQRNAAAFGGDAKNVTLFGESAGAESTCAQLASPAAAGLYRRAIIQSGPCALTTQWPYPDGNWVTRSRSVAERAGVAVAAKLGCNDVASAAACLRAKPVAALLDASDGGQGFGPVAGGNVLPLAPEQAQATGRFNRVPVIQGSNRDEHRTFQAFIDYFTGHPVTADEYGQQLDAFFGKAKAAKILARYPLRNYSSPSLALASVWTDSAWGCTALSTDRLLSKYVPTHAYEFADENAPWASSSPAPSFPTGSFHAAELQYLFNDEQFAGKLTAAQQRLSDTMIRYWTRFAHTGNPNGPGTPRWAGFSPANEQVQSLAPAPGGIGPVNLGNEHQCGFWQSLNR